MERQQVVNVITTAMEKRLLTADELTKRQAMAMSGRPMMTFADAEKLLKQAESELAAELLTKHVYLKSAVSCACGHRYYNDKPMSDGRCRFCHDEERERREQEHREQRDRERRERERIKRDEDDWRDPGVLYS